MINDIKHEAEETADPHVTKSVAACKKLFAKSVASCTTEATSHCHNMRNDIKHEAEEKAVPHVGESATDDASTDSDVVIKR